MANFIQTLATSKKMKNIIFLINISILFQSCISLKDMNSLEPKIINSGDQKKLDGVYSNQPTDSVNIDGYDLRTLLLRPFYNYSLEEEKNYSGEIELKQISDKKLKVSYLKNGEVKESKNLKGKFKNGFFSVRRKLIPIGIPLIFYVYLERRIMIGLDDDKLIIKTRKYAFAQILLLFAGDKHDSLKNNFKKKKPNS